MIRRVLSDPIWEELQKIMKKKGCKSSKNNRNIMEAILWKLRTGAPWRDVPKELCPWKTAYNRFNRWAQKGLWSDFFLLYGKKVDTKWTFVDGSYIRAHQHAQGARRGESRAIGRSRGGPTTKIHMAANADGNPNRF